jgi:glucose/arabinose dehydrogenase
MTRKALTTTAVLALALTGCGTASTSVKSTYTPLTTTQQAQPTDRNWDPPSRDVVTFKGNGTKNLGNVDVAYDGTISWTSDGSVFVIRFPDGPDAEIVSQASSGTSAISAGSIRTSRSRRLATGRSGS